MSAFVLWYICLLNAVKILEVLRPFVALLPEVSKPERKVIHINLQVVFYTSYNTIAT